MKKFLVIVVLGLLLSGNAYADGYLFPEALFTDGDIITEKDPTTFENIVFIKKKKNKVVGQKKWH